MNGAAETLHPVPARAAVLRENLRAVGESVRLEIAAALALLLGLALLIVLNEPMASPGGADYDVADMTWPVMVLGLFAPLAVWKAEEPSRRGYLWSLPVDRFRHTLMKVASGWGWLMGLVAAYLVWAISIPLLTGGHIVINPEWEAALLRGRPAGTVLRDMTLGGNAWLWLVPFVAASTGYFVGTAVALVSDHPLRVYAGVVFTFFVTIALAESVGGTLEHMADGLFRYGVAGRHGLFTHVTGIVFRFDEPLPAGGGIRDLPVFGAWAWTALVWTGTGLAAMLLAARRHQER
ncbi:MAG: hypothetical protein KY444_04830 [Gemmatimonadetes bacterium]|nr:hypothetical protein [Gemmatimonadota bacterium]